MWILNHRTKLSFLLALVGLSSASACVHLDLERLIENPRAYEGKRVCVVGVTEGDGVDFAFFKPPHRESSRSILVYQRRDARLYELEDGHWVRLKGIVVPDETGQFACKLLLERLQRLDRRPVPGRRIFGMFENAGPDSVRLVKVNDAENQMFHMTLAPGDIDKTVITDGKIGVFALSPDSSPVRLLSVYPIPASNSAPNYFDKSTQTFYFRVANGTISPVRPDKAQRMRKRWNSLQGK